MTGRRWDAQGNLIEDRAEADQPQANAARPRRTWGADGQETTQAPRQPGQLDWDENGRLIPDARFQQPPPPQPQRQRQPRVGPVEDVHRSTRSGIPVGLAAIAALPREINDISANWAEENRVFGDNEGLRRALFGTPGTEDTPSIPWPSTSELVEGFEEGAGVELWEPQTTAGEYGRTIGEFASGGLSPGGIGARTARVVVPAVASEAAGQATAGTEWEGPARFAGAIVGGIGTEARLAASRSAGRREASELDDWNAQAEARALEEEFGPMTAGERSRDYVGIGREQNLRRAGPAQESMRGFDDQRAPLIGDNLMRRIATRGQEPINPDLGSAGTNLADDLRTQHDTMMTERAARYRRAMEEAANHKITPTDELLSTVQNTSREHFGNLDNGAVQIIRDLHGEIVTGRATYARIERARQALNDELGDAMRAGNGRQVQAVHRIIDDLDAFAEARVTGKARSAIREARTFSREMSEMYGEQLRPDLSTGHTGRRDPGGRLMQNILDTEMTGEQLITSIFSTGARPTRAALGFARRIKDNATRQTSTGGYEAPSAGTGQQARTPGRRTLRGGRSTKGGRQFDPSPAQQERFGTELPRDDLQSLREAFVYHLERPLAGRAEGAAIPARTMATNLRQALHGPGKEITRVIFNQGEIQAMERALKYLEHVSPPDYFPSAPGIDQAAVERSMAALAARLIGKLPVVGQGIGSAIETGVVNARALKDAQAAITPPTPPRRRPRTTSPPAPASQQGLNAGIAIGAGGEEDEPPRRIGDFPR